MSFTSPLEAIIILAGLMSLCSIMCLSQEYLSAWGKQCHDVVLDRIAHGVSTG